MSRCRCSVVGGGCSRRGSPGAGAAAIACLALMVGVGLKRENVIVCDSKGVIHHQREDRLDESKRRYVQRTSARTLADVITPRSIGPIRSPLLVFTRNGWSS